MIVRLAAEAMATRFELVLSGEDEFSLRAAGEQAIAAIEEEHRRLNLFDPGSLIGRINTEADRRPMPLDRDLLDLLDLCADVRRQSGGAFDPAVGALMHRWGHRGLAGSEEPPRGFDCVRLDRDARTIAFTEPGVAIDLGGIAKGYALDRAATILRDAGIRCALLHGGTSSITAIGAPPRADGWRIRLAVPAVPAAELLLRDSSASISAPSGRLSDFGAGHIIDPRSAEPARHVQAAVVTGPSGALAEAWSTALVVLGCRPDTMPPEMGWALCAGSVWQAGPSIRAAFHEPAPGTEWECEK